MPTILKQAALLSAAQPKFSRDFFFLFIRKEKKNKNDGSMRLTSCPAV